MSTDDVELERKFGFFECSVDVLTRVCSKSSKISSCRLPDGVQLPLVLREPLLHDMYIYFLSIIPEDSEKGSLSHIFMGCADVLCCVILCMVLISQASGVGKQ